MDIGVTRDAIEAMERAALAAFPREACGILLGEGARISAFVETRNVHPTPESHFEIDPAALIAEHRSERAGAAKIVGYFHSHPAGDPCPSATDRASSARDGKVWAIAVEESIAFWRDDTSGFNALSYTVIGR